MMKKVIPLALAAFGFLASAENAGAKIKQGPPTGEVPSAPAVKPVGEATQAKGPVMADFVPAGEHCQAYPLSTDRFLGIIRTETGLAAAFSETNAPWKGAAGHGTGLESMSFYLGQDNLKVALAGARGIEPHRQCEFEEAIKVLNRQLAAQGGPALQLK